MVSDAQAEGTILNDDGVPLVIDDVSYDASSASWNGEMQERRGHRQGAPRGTGGTFIARNRPRITTQIVQDTFQHVRTFRDWEQKALQDFLGDASSGIGWWLRLSTGSSLRMLRCLTIMTTQQLGDAALKVETNENNKPTGETSAFKGSVFHNSL